MNADSLSGAAQPELWRELRASDARFHAIVHKSADSMIVVSPAGAILFVNPAAELLLGQPSDKLLGEIFGTPLVPGEKTEIDILQYGKRSCIAEMRVVAIEWHGEPAFLATLRDITDHKAAEEEALNAVRRRDQFLAALSHELRNPLAAVANAAEVIRPWAAADPSLARARDVIQRQCGQMTRLLDDLLDVSRISQEKIALRKERLDLRSSIQDAIHAVRPVVQERQIRLHVELCDAPLTVNADAVRLYQILVNLLSNAAKYTEAGGDIWLSALGDGSSAVVRVRDTGVGIPTHMLESIFDPFVQADHSLARSEGGLGIGLSLVRSLVELHGGSVAAHCEGVGCGSEFVVRLPLAAGGAAPPKPADNPGRSRPLRVLVVEDNDDVREMLKCLLELEGHEVEIASDGRQGADFIEFQRPDVALVDIGLPVLSGYDVARRVRANSQGGQVFLVALTGYGRPEDRKLALEAGFDAHLVKPVDIRTLTRLLADRSRRCGCADRRAVGQGR